MAGKHTKKTTKYKTLTTHTKELLAGEDVDSEFKERAAALKQETFVSFANTTGGYVLVGVNDQGTIVGAPHDDEAMKSIQSIASTCIPPVQIEITVENTNAKALIKIHVPSSPWKPHCTGSGKYVVRVKNRHDAMAPIQLLALFLEKESTTFLQRFEEASRQLVSDTKNLGSLVAGVRTQLAEKVADLVSQLDTVHQSVESLPHELDELREHLAQTVQTETEKLETAIDRMETLVGELRGSVVNDVYEDLAYVHHKLDIVMQHMGFQDPRLAARKQALRRQLRRAHATFRECGMEATEENLLEYARKIFSDVGENDLREVAREALEGG